MSDDNSTPVSQRQSQPDPTAWGQPIYDDRKPELENLFERQRAWANQPAETRGKSVFARETLTGADVSWLAERSGRDREGRVPNLHLESAGLGKTFLKDAKLRQAHLEGVYLGAAHLESANLLGTHLEGADLRQANLKGADLRGARLSEDTDLAEVVLGPGSFADLLDHLRLRNRNAALGDIKWRDADLTAILWERVQRLGDERYARWRNGAKQHRAVVRAYRQVAAQLRAQGMADDADRFSYRAQIRQRGVLLRTWRIPQYLFSWLLAILAGYGYRPGRTLFWYLLIVLGYAAAYLHIGPSAGVPFSLLGALVFSVTSFHGRGFFPGGSPGHSISLDNSLIVLAASEAVIGLLIEISFIATFTQRYFGSK